MVFICDESISGPMQLVDQWTLLMAVFLGVQAVTAGLAKKYTDDDEEEEEEGAEA